MIQKDLESLTGKLISGDVTLLVYELLKDSKHKETLLDYEYLTIDKSLIDKIKKGVELLNANNKESRNNTGKESSGGLSLERWLTERGISN